VSQLHTLDWQADEVDAALRDAGVSLSSDASPTDDSLWTYDSWPDYAQRDLPAGRSLAWDPWSHFYPPRRGLLLLRDLIRAALARARHDADADEGLGDGGEEGLGDGGEEGLVVYVSRSDAASGGFGIRTLPNEALLVAALRAVAPGRVRVFRGRDMSLRDQLAMFAQAAVVVAPHGAGLANLVACAPQTALVMFPMQPHVDNTFGHMAAALQLPLWIAPDIASYYYGRYPLLTPTAVLGVAQAVHDQLAARGLPAHPAVVDARDFDEWVRKHGPAPAVHVPDDAWLGAAGTVDGAAMEAGKKGSGKKKKAKKAKVDRTEL
jgi:hypothetical protein